MNTRHALDVIQVRSPCPVDWDEMSGDRQTRFCQHCQKHVQNLSAMPADEAERLVCQSAGRLCVRFERDAAGEVITLNYRGTNQRRWTWKVWTLVALAGALITGTVEAVFFGSRLQNAIPPVAPMMGRPSVMVGDIAPPIAPTPTNPQNAGDGQ